MGLLAQGLASRAAAPGLSRAPLHPTSAPHVCSPAWTSSVGHSTAAQGDVATRHICWQPSLAQVAGQGRRVAWLWPPQGMGPATVTEQLVTLPCPCAIAFRAQEKGWVVAGAEGLFLLWLMSLLLHAGPQGGSPRLQAGRSLPGAGSISHHDLNENPCSWIFNSSLVLGGEWEEAQLRSHCEVLQMLVLEPFSRPFPLPTS